MTARHLIPGLILAVLVVPSLSAAPDGTQALIERLEKSVKGDKKPFTLVVQIHVKPGTEAKFEATAAKTVKATVAEKGCLGYGLHRDLEKPGHYTLVERWKGLAALRKHLEEKHTKKLLALLPEVSTMPLAIDIYAPVAGK